MRRDLEHGGRSVHAPHEFTATKTSGTPARREAPAHGVSARSLFTAKESHTPRMIKFIPLHRVALGVLTAALVACDPDSPAPTPLPVVPDVIADGGSCPEPTGPGTQHSTSVTTNEVWTAAESPHFVTTSIDVVADLTLEPCALVVLSRGVGMTVDGTLTARGGHRLPPSIDLTEAEAGLRPGASPPRVPHDSDDAFDIRPVVFTSTSDDPADNWGTLTVEPLGRVDLEVTALIHAAHPDAAQNGGGALLVRGTNDSTVTKSPRWRRPPPPPPAPPPPARGPPARDLHPPPAPTATPPRDDSGSRSRFARVSRAAARSLVESRSRFLAVRVGVGRRLRREPPSRRVAPGLARGVGAFALALTG